jgi:type I restriction enzyme S subunit
MKHWPTTTLGEIAGEGQYGLNAPAMSEGTGVRFVRITDITQGGELRHEEPAFIPRQTPDLDNYELKDGDVLIARSGATVGKSYVHQSFGERAVFAGYLIRFQPDTSRVLPGFIGAFLRTVDYWRQLNSHKRAVAQPNVNAKQLASLVLPLPPMTEQVRLVTLLEEADELRKMHSEAGRRTSNVIPALFDEMFGKHLESPPVLVSIEGATAPKGWRWCQLIDVARLATGHTPSRRISGYWNGNIPWMSLTDIRALDGTVAQSTIQSVTEEGIANSSAVKLPKGYAFREQHQLDLSR